MVPDPLKEDLKTEALRLGFDVCGIAAAGPLADGEYLQAWLDEGRAGDMTAWLGREPERRMAPAHLLPGVKSIIMLGLNYYQPPPPARGRVATYALGKDYHDLIPPKLRDLDNWLSLKGGRQRFAVDTAAILEKSLAARAGIGWTGKSTMLIHPRMGTWLFLAELLTTLELEPDLPVKNHCGACTRCIDVCPTGAITNPYQLDARLCIAYLTIEHKGPIPEELRIKMGDHVYGCDDCLSVCPWNRWAQQTREAGLHVISRPDLRDMLDWDDARFRREFRGTPLFRLKRNRWLRNVCVVLGNIGGVEDLSSLARAVMDSDPLIAEHARWAVTRIAGRTGAGTPWKLTDDLA